MIDDRLVIDLADNGCVLKHLLDPLGVPVDEVRNALSVRLRRAARQWWRSESRPPFTCRPGPPCR